MREQFTAMPATQKKQYGRRYKKRKKKKTFSFVQEIRRGNIGLTKLGAAKTLVAAMQLVPAC